MSRISSHLHLHLHRRQAVGLAALIPFALWASQLRAAEGSYPDHVIRIINPFPSGSPVDFVGRLIAERLRGVWGQPVVVESRSGAGGTVGTGFVAKAQPDGYTLLVSTSSTLTIAPSIFRALPYDPARDLIPLWAIVSGGLVMVVRESFEARSVPEFLQRVRGRPGEVSYASAGPGSPQHLAAEQFMARSGTQLMHVPYQGAVPALRDVMAGHVDVMFDSIINVIPQLDTGRLRALALLRNQRSSAMPNLPTMAEAGLQGVEIPGAIGLFAPGGTPMEVVQTLTTTVAQLMLEPANREKLVAAGNRDEMLSGAGLASQLAEERAFFAGLVRRAGVEPQ